jgi:hypothetical protein
MAHMYKICRGKDGQNRADWFKPPMEAAARTRRHADPLNVGPLRSRLEILRKFFTVHASECWNVIPSSIKHAGTAAKFKRDYAMFGEAMI